MRYKEEAPEAFGEVSKGLKDCKHHEHSTTLKNPVNIAVTVEGKIAGYIRGDSFHKRVIGSKHQLRKPPAWCISKEAFCERVLPNTENIIIEDVAAGVSYECPTKVFAERAFEIQRGNFEPQLAMELRFWTLTRNGHQPRLWGGQQHGN